VLLSRQAGQTVDQHDASGLSRNARLPATHCRLPVGVKPIRSHSCTSGWPRGGHERSCTETAHVCTQYQNTGSLRTRTSPDCLTEPRPLATGFDQQCSRACVSSSGQRPPLREAAAAVAVVAVLTLAPSSHVCVVHEGVFRRCGEIECSTVRTCQHLPRLQKERHLS
jgi:hypothetical protein